jgi:hypothetical protein
VLGKLLYRFPTHNPIMFPRKIAAVIVVALLVTNLAFLVSMQATDAQMFTQNLFMISNSDVNVSYGESFSVTVTNLLNESIWLFCLSDRNITRVDAPVFLTINATESYTFRFISPPKGNESEYNEETGEETPVNGQTTYSVYFGGVDNSASSFQTSQVLLTMTSVQSLNYQISQLLIQNRQLMKQMLALQDKAGMNNGLVIVAVVSNVFWLCVIIGIKFYKPQRQNTLTDAGPITPAEEQTDMVAQEEQQ